MTKKKSNKKEIFKIIHQKIQKACELDQKKLNTETDDIKKLQLSYKINAKSISVLLNEIKKLSDSEWDSYVEESFDPLIKQTESIAEKFDTIAMRKSKDSREYEKYVKMKKVTVRGNNKVFRIIDSIDLSRKQLERLLVLIFRVMVNTENTARQSNIDFYEFLETGNIVNRRFGFDYNWLVCLSLIQVYENLIRKKITELGYTIRDSDTLDSLIPQLSNLIREKENRNVHLALKMSDGLKRTRNSMTHQGYNQPVLKSDLEKIFREISDLEQILYPETKLEN